MNKERTVIIAAIITGIFGCMSAIIGLGVPFVEKTMENSSVASTDAVSIATTTTSSSSERPANVSISDGENFSPSLGWIWVCGGDFDAILPNGNTVTLHDWAEPGLIIILESNSQVIINAPWGGYCEPSTQSGLSTTLQRFLDNGFQRGCENDNGCLSINVKKLDPNGNIVDDYWVQHP